jgi:hypothetical protein
VAEFPVSGQGWVTEGLPYMDKHKKRLVESLGAGPDLWGGEATAGISPRTADRVMEVLRRRGYRPWAFVRARKRGLERIAEGDAAVDSYVSEIKPHRDHFHWPGGSLVFEDPASGSRFVLDTDLDGTVLELLSWGPDARPALTEVLDAVWRLMGEA